MLWVQTEVSGDPPPHQKPVRKSVSHILSGKKKKKNPPPQPIEPPPSKMSENYKFAWSVTRRLQLTHWATTVPATAIVVWPLSLSRFSDYTPKVIELRYASAHSLEAYVTN